MDTRAVQGGSPRSPPPQDSESDEDDAYDHAVDNARSAMGSEVWEAFSPERKKKCIQEQMDLLKAKR